MNESLKMSDVVSRIKLMKLEISQKEDYLRAIDQIVSDFENKIMAKKESIKLKKLFNSLPHQAIGTIEYRNKLNERSQLFGRESFNKITRLLDFVEKTEKSYNQIYQESISNYYIDPFLPCYNICIKEFNSLNEYYKLLETLIFDIDRDVVKYNMVYNFLDDKGVFTTSLEKWNLQLVNDISNSVRLIYGELTDIVLNLDNIDETIRAIQQETSSKYSHLWVISDRVSIFD